MSKAEILSELPRLTPVERAEILEVIWELEEAAGPTEQERAVLQEAQASYDANPAAGSSWQEVEARLRKQS